MKDRLIIFDADSIIFTVAWAFRTKKATRLVEMQVNKFITDVLSNSKASHYIGFFGSKKEGALPNFRYDVDPQYKANRPPTPDFVIKWRPIILRVFEEKWGFIPVEGMEADDAAAIAADHYKDDYDITIATFDKDLKQIPNSTFYNMRVHEQTYINEFDAHWNLSMQLLQGDKGTDNIPGLPGIGPKKAKLLLQDCTTLSQLKWKVLRSYSEFESISRDKKQVQLIKDIKESLLVEEAVIPEEYKDLEGARLQRRIRINVAKELSSYMDGLIKGGWKTYFKQQDALLRMLTKSPDFFTIPNVQDSPMYLDLTTKPTDKVLSTDAITRDDFLTI